MIWPGVLSKKKKNPKYLAVHKDSGQAQTPHISDLKKKVIKKNANMPCNVFNLHSFFTANGSLHVTN